MIPGRGRHRWVPVIVALLVGCHQTPQPTDYIRVDGVAPPLQDVPAARALLVAFWATWCPPCREETRQLRALAANPPAAVQVVVVSQDIDRGVVEEFFGGPPDPALHLRLDPERKLFSAFGVETLPASFLIVDGELRARFEGARQWGGKPVRALLERLIAEERNGP